MVCSEYPYISPINSFSIKKPFHQQLNTGKRGLQQFWKYDKEYMSASYAFSGVFGDSLEAVQTIASFFVVNKKATKRIYLFPE